MVEIYFKSLVRVPSVHMKNILRHWTLIISFLSDILRTTSDMFNNKSYIYFKLISSIILSDILAQNVGHIAL